MTRAYTGLLALDGLLLCTGGCVLYGLGLLRDWRSALRLSGLSFVVGWACFGVMASFALAAGLALTTLEAVLICGLVAAGGILIGFRISAAAPPAGPTPRPGWLRWLGLAAACLLALYLVATLVKAFVAPADEFWDSWAFWLPKAKSIYYFKGLDSGLGGFTRFASRDYPPLLPGFDAAAFHFMGGVHPAALPVQEWVFGAAFFTAAGALLVRRAPAGLVWPALATIAVMPRFGTYLLSALADAPVAIMLGLAAVCGALWFLDDEVRYASLCGIFLAAAALLKNEGLLFGLFLVVTLSGAILLYERSRWRPMIVLALVPLLAILPWKIWLAANDQPTSSLLYSYRDVFRPAFLADRADRLEKAVSELPGYMFAPSRWLLTIPLALAAAALVVRRRPGLVVVQAGFVALVFLGLSMIYWIGLVPIDFYIATSAERVVLSAVIVSGLMLPLLLSEALVTWTASVTALPRAPTPASIRVGVGMNDYRGI